MQSQKFNMPNNKITKIDSLSGAGQLRPESKTSTEIKSLSGADLLKPIPKQNSGEKKKN